MQYFSHSFTTTAHFKSIQNTTHSLKHYYMNSGNLFKYKYTKHDNSNTVQNHRGEAYRHLSNTGAQTSLYERFISCLVFIRFHFV